MRLERQLAAFVLAAAALIGLISLWLQLQSMGQSLQHQVASRASAVASTLSAAQIVTANDLEALTDVVETLYARGGISDIAVLDRRGGVVIARTSPSMTPSVPAWFVDFVGFSSAAAQRSLTHGGRVVGSVRVRVDAAGAYLDLWLTLLGNCLVLLLAGASCLLLTMLGLHRVLRPLRDMETRAQDGSVSTGIRRGEVARSGRLPEMARRFDDLIGRLEIQSARQTEFLENLRTDHILDPVTGLGTAVDFQERLHHLFEEPESLPGTTIFIVNVSGERADGQARFRDRLLADAGEIVRDCCSGGPAWFAGRLADDELAIVVSDADTEWRRMLASSLAAGLRHLGGSGSGDRNRGTGLGLAAYRVTDNARDLIARAREAVSYVSNAAWSTTSGVTCLQEVGECMMVSSADLARVLREGRIQVHYQPLVACRAGGARMQLEALARIDDVGAKTLPARSFVPIAESLGRHAELDRLVLSRILSEMDEHEDEVRIAVNVSPASIRDEMFMEWVMRALARDSLKATRLDFEVHEDGVVSSCDDLERWIQSLAPLGCRFGVDHFGRALHVPTCLSDLALNYVKVDGSFTRGLDTRPANQLSLRALVGLARQAGIEIYAEAVESPGEWQALRGLEFAGAQGRFLGEPRALLSDTATPRRQVG